jgi:multidrug efflux system membrane fusion protein
MKKNTARSARHCRRRAAGAWYMNRGEGAEAAKKAGRPRAARAAPAADGRQRGGAAAPGRAGGRRRRQRHRHAAAHRRPASADHQHHPPGPHQGRPVRESRRADVLARRPQRPASVDKAQAQVARDRATLADLERQYKRSQDLVRPEIPRPERRRHPAQPGRGGARALAANSAAVRASQVSASYTAIRAPMSGRVGAINVYPGSLVQPATSLTTVTQLDPIDVAFTLPEVQPAGSCWRPRSRARSRSKRAPAAHGAGDRRTQLCRQHGRPDQPAPSASRRSSPTATACCGRAST